MTCDHAHLDGCYVLGSLPAGERTDYERHLAGCEECSRGVRELAGLPGLLGRVSVDVLETTGEQEPAPALLPVLLTEVRRRRRGRRVRTLAVAAAAAVLISASVAAAIGAFGDRADPPSAAPVDPAVSTAPSEQMDSTVSDAIAGWLSLTEVGWGTRIDLTCSYGGDSDAAWTYVMLVRTTNGDVEEVGTWRATPGKETHVGMATSVRPDQIESVVVETADGRTVLSLEGSADR